jgi:CBS domain-containing membrane protein
MSPLTQLVGTLMAPDPIRVRPDERLDIALALMVSYRFRHLPVEDDGRLVGVLSMRDLYAADLAEPVSSRGERALHLRGIEARQVMSTPVLTTQPAATLFSASELLLRRQISCLPVVEEQRLVGILTCTDLLAPAIALLESEAARGTQTAVSAIMTVRPIATIEADEHLDLARSLMNAHRVRHLPVVEADHVVGVLSDHDLLRAELSNLTPAAAAERLAARRRVRVREMMAGHAATLDSESPAVEAARVLQRRRFGALPVISSGRLVGMLTVSDFLYYLLSYAPSDELRAARR